MRINEWMSRFEIKQRKNRGDFFFGSKEERFRVTAHLKDKEL